MEARIASLEEELEEEQSNVEVSNLVVLVFKKDKDRKFLLFSYLSLLLTCSIESSTEQNIIFLNRS